MEMSDDLVFVDSSRLKSTVWKDFDRMKKGDTCVAICKHCRRVLCGSSTSGTSHLRNHIVRCKRRLHHDVSQMLVAKGKKKERTLALANESFGQKQKREMTSFRSTKFDTCQTKESGNICFDQTQSRFDLARMILLHGYSLDMVEDIGFQIFVRNLQPLFELGTFNEVEHDCMEIYEKEKQKVSDVLDKLPGKISLSADMWSAKGNTDYLSLSAHYIDEAWQLNRKILNFIVVDPSQTEDMLSEVIMNCLMDWDIDRKLFSVTLDTCSTYDNIIQRIKDRLSEQRFLLCNGQLFDVRCATNVITLMVQDALETLYDVTHKVRESIRYVRSSQATEVKFNEMVRLGGVNSKKCLSLDNSLQWRSTYIMLEVALEYKLAFSSLQEHDPLYTMCPSNLEWDRASAITSFLKLFFEVSNVFAGSKQLTANIFFPEICDIHLQLIEWCQISDDYISSLALKMKCKFDDYWKKCSLALAIAAILDPRFKMKLVEYYYPQIYGDSAAECIDIVSNCMKALYNGHALYSPLASHGQGLACEVGGSGSGDDYTDRLVGFDKFVNEKSPSRCVKSDLDKYLEEPLFPRNVDFSVLNWWKVHTPRYPILSMMARNILGIPLSKVASESVFDRVDRVLDHHQSSQKSKTVQALICTQDWMRNDSEGSNSSSSPSTLALCYDEN